MTKETTFSEIPIGGKFSCRLVHAGKERLRIIERVKEVIGRNAVEVFPDKGHKRLFPRDHVVRPLTGEGGEG